MVDQKSKRDCCGCGACAQACPFDAIVMKEDDRGFLFPVIDKAKCKYCGICNKVCGFTDDNLFLSDGEPKIIAAKIKTEADRKESTSGGVFTALSDYVLSKGGVVFGASYNENLTVRHEAVTNVAGRNRLRSSKYVQSDIGNTYIEAKEYLDAGRMVLYTGTPCQIASLRTFLKKDYDNLLTVDVVCHGVPSDKVWHEFLTLLEKKSKSKVVGANFRDKSAFGWHRPQMSFVYEDGKERRLYFDQSFFEMFNTNLFLRESCLHCKLISYQRPSDISIADYWGIERFRKDFDDNRGTSMILLNTQKGQRFFDSVKDNMEYFYSDKEHCYQGRLQGRSYIHPQTDIFWEEYKNHGLKYVLVKYTEYYPAQRFMRKVKGRLKRAFTSTKES